MMYAVLTQCTQPMQRAGHGFMQVYQVGDCSTLNPGIIAGPVVAGVVLIAAAIGGLWYWHRRRVAYKTKLELAAHNEGEEPAPANETAEGQPGTSKDDIPLPEGFPPTAAASTSASASGQVAAAVVVSVPPAHAQAAAGGNDNPAAAADKPVAEALPDVAPVKPHTPPR